MDTHAEVALPAGGDKILKATKLAMSKKHTEYTRSRLLNG